MTVAEFKKLETILAKIETLQLQTSDKQAQEAMQEAKSALIRFSRTAQR